MMILLSLPCVLGFNVWSGFPCVRRELQATTSRTSSCQQHLAAAAQFAGLPAVRRTSAAVRGWKNFKEAGKGGGFKVKDNIRFMQAISLRLSLYIILHSAWDKFF